MRPAESFIGQPVRSLQTMLRVLAQVTPSLPTVIPDGIYGPTTKQAVAAFQRTNALPATGLTDQYTWDRIVDAYESTVVNVAAAEVIEILIDPDTVFQLGDSNPYIYLVQSILIQLSNDHNAIDTPNHTGVMDASTARALTQFQELSNLNPTGKLDKQTWKYLARHFTLNAHHNMRKEK